MTCPYNPSDTCTQKGVTKFYRIEIDVIQKATAVLLDLTVHTILILLARLRYIQHELQSSTNTSPDPSLDPSCVF